MPDGKTHAWWTIKRDMARTVTYYLLNVHMYHMRCLRCCGALGHDRNPPSCTSSTGRRRPPPARCGVEPYAEAGCAAQAAAESDGAADESIGAA